MSDSSSVRKRSRGDSDSEEGSQKLTNSKRNGSQLDGPVAAAYSAVSHVHDIASLDECVDLPEYVVQNANTLTFPEKLMLTLMHVDRVVAATGKSATSIAWVLEGHAFVINDKDRFCAEWVPIFFGQAKFSSFTRKLYRWGFRKVNLAPHHVTESAPPGALYFGNEYFQRDQKELLVNMKSVTAAKTRTELSLKRKKRAMSRPGVVPGNIQLNTGCDQVVVGQQVLPIPLPPQPLQTQGGFGLAAVNSINQAALLQALNMVNLQSQLSAVQAGTPVSAPWDPSQLLVSVLSHAATARAQQEPNMVLPVVAPSTAPVQVQQPHLAAWPPQLGITAPPGLAVADPAGQERLWQAIQMLLVPQSGQQPEPQDRPPLPAP